MASLPPFFTFQSAVSDSCRFLPSHIPLWASPSISFRLELFPWWVTCCHFYASSLVQVTASLSTGLNSHFSIRRAVTFIFILRRSNICPTAVGLRITHLAIHSHVIPNPCAVIFSSNFFLSFIFYFFHDHYLLLLRNGLHTVYKIIFFTWGEFSIFYGYSSVCFHKYFKLFLFER